MAKTTMATTEKGASIAQNGPAQAAKKEIEGMLVGQPTILNELESFTSMISLGSQAPNPKAVAARARADEAGAVVEIISNEKKQEARYKDAERVTQAAAEPDTSGVVVNPTGCSRRELCTNQDSMQDHGSSYSSSSSSSVRSSIFSFPNRVWAQAPAGLRPPMAVKDCSRRELCTNKESTQDGSSSKGSSSKGSSCKGKQHSFGQRVFEAASFGSSSNKKKTGLLESTSFGNCQRSTGLSGSNVQPSEHSVFVRAGVTPTVLYPHKFPNH